MDKSVRAHGHFWIVDRHIRKKHIICTNCKCPLLAQVNNARNRVITFQHVLFNCIIMWNNQVIWQRHILHSIVVVQRGRTNTVGPFDAGSEMAVIAMCNCKQLKSANMYFVQKLYTARTVGRIWVSHRAVWTIGRCRYQTRQSIRTTDSWTRTARRRSCVDSDTSYSRWWLALRAAAKVFEGRPCSFIYYNLHLPWTSFNLHLCIIKNSFFANRDIRVILFVRTANSTSHGRSCCEDRYKMIHE